jgi:hypothetical protein
MESAFSITGERKERKKGREERLTAGPGVSSLSLFSFI